MTSEQKLQAIIEAQVKGGNERWKAVVGGHGIPYIMPGKEIVLVILLDPQGLRAAYGSVQTIIETGDAQKTILLKAVYEHLKITRAIPAYWEWAGYFIFNTWLSSNGDAAKTIDTAYSLLPKE